MLAPRWHRPAARQRARPRPARVLILVQNATFPLDARVWPEALALTARGYEVHVICPRDDRYTRRRENIRGIRVYRYPPGPEGRGVLGYLLEYAVALPAQLFLALVIRFRFRVDVVHICNPPDLLFLAALPLKALGARVVYDHHDACPELMMAKGYRMGGWQVRLNTLLERLTYRACDVSLETNESFRNIAVGRGHMCQEDVFVVRNAPESTRFAGATADEKHRYGREHMVAYVGMMAIQDGLDYLIDAAHIVVADWQRHDIQFVLVGSGPELERLRERVRLLNLGDYMAFTGYIADPRMLGSILATADACVSPDPENPANNVSTMHKTMEYMTLGKPIVQFDLHEGRVSAGDASLYAAANDVTDFAKAIVQLIDDPEMRDRLGAIGFQRITTDLSWNAQVPSLLAAYDRAMAKPVEPTAASTLSSYSDRQLGMLGRTRELCALWQSKRQDVPGQAREMLAEMEDSQSEIERVLGGSLRNKDVLVIGPGQQLVEMSFFARHNRVTGIDLDVIPQHPSVREYLRMFRNNGSIRTLKTIGRKAMGYDRALRREVGRSGLTVDHDPSIVAMDAAAMTFPDGSFDCVFSHSCFEHLSEPGDVIRQVARVLRPGGVAHVDVHLYTSDSGCHDVRIFGGRRESIPPWSHLRPRYRHLVQPNSYLNEIRLAQWRDLCSQHWPGVTFRLRGERDPAIRSALASIRAGGELDEYEDEELLSVYLVAEWVKPGKAADGETLCT
jgi:glycosyltransferase involved in cell wall biosynthesis/SAM-dependent methyltransferase